MIPVLPKLVPYLARSVGAMLLIFTPLLAGAQVVPDMRGPLTVHLLGAYTYGSTVGGTNSYGYSLGGFVQTSHLWGLEVRGAYLRWGKR